MKPVILLTIDDKYVVVRDACVTFVPINEIKETDSYLFNFDFIYSSVEISTTHQGHRGCLSLSGQSVTFIFGEKSLETICFTSNDQGNQLMTTTEQLINFPIFHIIEYDEHMDKNFRMTEFRDGETICLSYVEEDDHDSYVDDGVHHYDPVKYLCVPSGDNHVCYKDAGHMTIYDIKHFVFDRTSGILKIRPFTDQQINDENLGSLSRGVNKGYLCADNPFLSVGEIPRGGYQITSSYPISYNPTLYFNQHANKQTKMFYDASEQMGISIGVKQIDTNKVILYNTKTDEELTPVLTKSAGCLYLCKPEKDKIIPQCDNFDSVNYTEKQFSRFKELYDKLGVSLKTPHGHLVISDGHVMLKEHVAPNDTFKFLLGKHTCTALSIMAIHNNQLGSIVGTNELKFVNNIDVFGHIYLGCTSWGNDKEIYGNHIIFEVIWGSRSYYDNMKKYITCDKNGQLTITRGRPERFYVSPDKYGYITKHPFDF